VCVSAVAGASSTWMVFVVFAVVASHAAAGAPVGRSTGNPPFPSAHAVYPNVPWPLPQHMTTGNQSIVLSPRLNMRCAAGAGCDPDACQANGTLARAFDRYVALVREEASS
jgi:hypothetical protein